MTLPIPLTVRIGDRHITHELSNLSCRWVVPGGNASARMSLNRSLQVHTDEVGYYQPVTIEDGRNGNIIWDGRLEDPGRNAGSQGEVWDIAALGGMAHASDRITPRIYVDQSTAPEEFDKSYHSVRYADVTTTTDDTDSSVVELNVDEGTTFVQNDWVCAVYRRLSDTFNQKLGRITYRWDAATTTVNNKVQIRTSIGSVGFLTNAAEATFNVAGGTLSAVVVTDFPFGETWAHIHSLRNGVSVVVGAGGLWLQVAPIIRTMLVDKSGGAILTGYTADTVTADEVVADLLGALLPEYDGPNASIDPGLYAIEQFAFPDGATPAEMLGKLMEFHPDHFWAAWERSTGGHRFEWRAWPTTVRYEVDVTDGFDTPGSATDLYNAVAVRWVGAQGRIRHTRRTQTVPELDDAGLTREGYIDLGLDAGSSGNAIRTGDQFLAEHAIPLSAGTLTIARPILDRDTGIMIQPWEIRPGELIRIRGVVPSQAALSATTRDGATIFRVVAVEYSTSTASATLELDVSPMTPRRGIAAKLGQLTSIRR